MGSVERERLTDIYVRALGVFYLVMRGLGTIFKENSLP